MSAKAYNDASISESYLSHSESNEHCPGCGEVAEVAIQTQGTALLVAIWMGIGWKGWALAGRSKKGSNRSTTRDAMSSHSPAALSAVLLCLAPHAHRLARSSSKHEPGLKYSIWAQGSTMAVSLEDADTTTTLQQTCSHLSPLKLVDPLEPLSRRHGRCSYATSTAFVGTCRCQV
ncbi:hypothetical protein PENSPDRAFT_428807 [Peniophora sp. CONT]|nr:hypothetical protein PENSPDRAFT_428807 [Peniophora sp. CONT]